MNYAKYFQLPSSTLKTLDVVKVLDFNYDLFKGATVQFNNDKSSDEHMSSLLSHPAIKNVWRKTVVSLPKHQVGAVGSPGLADSSQLLARNFQGNDTYSPHVMTQVDKLHAKGITGKGVKIAIVDSGVSATVKASNMRRLLQVTRPSPAVQVFPRSQRSS